MAIKLNSGRQEIINARLKVSLGTGGDVLAQGIYPAVALPEGAVVVGGEITCTDASTALSTIQLGAYSGAIAISATGTAALVPTGLEEASAVVLDLTVAGADPVAVGEVVVNVQYIVDGRTAFSQG